MENWSRPWMMVTMEAGWELHATAASTSVIRGCGAALGAATPSSATQPNKGHESRETCPFQDLLTIEFLHHFVFHCTSKTLTPYFFFRSSFPLSGL